MPPVKGGCAFIWIAATERGRPVSVRQGYLIESIIPGKKPFSHGDAMAGAFAATGGCGLGGNTAIIPEVQTLLDRRLNGQKHPAPGLK